MLLESLVWAFGALLAIPGAAYAGPVVYNVIGSRQRLFSVYGTDYALGTEMNWFEAYRICEKFHMKLATIKKPSHYAALIIFLGTNMSSIRSDVWVGATNLGFNITTWYWMKDGSSVSYSNWMPNEPCRIGCMRLSHKHNFTWNDAECSSNKFQFVCEHTKF
ncbi:perlucin-like protein [Scaptodrosophila lebanonensis]|uniref:Perlucin-like protein n=1 Tax=Drosophila lebanonensis TaxID=7225 RepID=A0A6J2TKY4_DROLE|nr:perlucin-like protein [Scaptodrosophila lebanonensis]